MMSTVLLITMMVMFATGFYLMMDRALTRILLGFILAGNAANLLIFLMSGTFGKAPLVVPGEKGDYSDPLPQAFILTAIVITFGITAFMLALMYRSWLLDRENDDTVLTDEEDKEISLSTESITPEEVLDTDVEMSQEFEDSDEQDTNVQDSGQQVRSPKDSDKQAETLTNEVNK